MLEESSEDRSSQDRAAWRFVWLLSGSKMVQIIVTSITVSFVGILGGDLAGDVAYGTIPMMLVLFSAGLITLPASLLLARFGHRRNYVLSNLLGAGGSLAIALAIPLGSFPVLCLGCVAIGFYHAFAQYYRFSAANAVSDAEKGQAISTVLVGGILAAFLGPVIASFSQDFFPPFIFIGPFVVLGAILALNAVLFVAAGDTAPLAATGSRSTRPHEQPDHEGPEFHHRVLPRGIFPYHDVLSDDRDPDRRRRLRL